jgi:hypothetical protein
VRTSSTAHRHEAAAQRHGDEVLHQHVQRLLRRRARLDLAGLRRCARGHAFDEFQAVRGHHGDARRPARRVAGAAGALQQAGHALGRADLQHPLHRQKVHPQIEAGGADHARKVPALRPCSTQSRTARSSEPWCSAIWPAQSGRASSRAWYQSSACARVLVNTSVVALASISRTTCGSRVRPRWPAQGKRSARSGSRVSTVSVLGVCAAHQPALAARPGARAGCAGLRAGCPAWPTCPRRAGRVPVAQPGQASCTCTPRLLPMQFVPFVHHHQPVRPSVPARRRGRSAGSGFRAW